MKSFPEEKFNFWCFLRLPDKIIPCHIRRLGFNKRIMDLKFGKICSTLAKSHVAVVGLIRGVGTLWEQDPLEAFFLMWITKDQSKGYVHSKKGASRQYYAEVLRKNSGILKSE